jgi:hypothetical protein
VDLLFPGMINAFFCRILMLIADSYPYEILPLIIANLGNVSLSTSQMLIFLAQ